MNKTKWMRVLLCMTITVLLLGITGSFAWLNKNNNSIDPQIHDATVIKQYFHCGTGEENDPFVITRPIHYYHLVELYQRKDHFAEGNYYFQLGYQLEQGSSDFKVYAYDKFGNLIYDAQGNPTYSTVLNMEYYSGEFALLPVGTSDVPFNGTFEGKGLTIANLSIKASETVNDKEYGTSDLGIFGYLGADCDVENVYFDNLTLYLADLDVSRTTTDNSHNDNVHKIPENSANMNTCYVGFIAGHVRTASTVENVFVNNATMVGGSAAMNGFGYFGCVEDALGKNIPTLGSLVAEQRGRGDDAGFGGSIDMKSMFNRLNGMFTSPAATVRNPNAETVWIDEVTGQRVVTVTQREDDNAKADGNTVYYYQKDNSGSYYMFKRNSGSDWTAVYLYGENTRSNTKTVTQYVIKKNASGEYQQVVGYKISDGANFLQRNGNNVASTNEGSATVWFFDQSGHLFTYESIMEHDGETYVDTASQKYYLNRSNTYGVTISTTASTTWTRTNDDSLYTVNNGNYYLNYFNGWELTNVLQSYRIHDGNGHYLSGSATAVSNVSSADESVRWQGANMSGNETTFYAVIGGSTKYLYFDGTLQMSSNSTTWYRDGNGYYALVQGVRFYLTYKNGWTAESISGKYLSQGTNYLSLNGTNISNQTTANNATVWQMTEANGETQLFVIYNGQKLYLTTSGNTLTTSTTAASWKKNQNAYYRTGSDGKDYYLLFENNWTVAPLVYFQIHDNNGNYLRASGANTFANGTAANATSFYFSADNGAQSNGTVRYWVNGNEYYLGQNNGSFANTATSWLNDGNSLYVTSGTTTYSVCYDGTWRIKTIEPGFYITNGSSYMTVNGTTIGNTTNVNEATVFVFSTTGTNPAGTIKVAGTNYYLRNNNNVLEVSNTSTTWSNDGTNIYSGTWKIYYLGGKWILSPSTYYYLKSSDGYYVCSTNNTDLTAATSTANAVRFASNSGTIQAIGTNKYLYSTEANRGAASLNTTSRSWTLDDGRLYWTTTGWGTTYYSFQRNNNAWRVRTNTSYSTMSFEAGIMTGQSTAQAVSTERPVVKVLKKTRTLPAMTETDYSLDIPAVTIQGPVTEDYSLSFLEDSFGVLEKTILNNQESGYPTYIPLRVPRAATADKPADSDYNSSDLLKASIKNTGYIIGGGNFYDGSTNGTRVGDIRVSSYAITNIRNSFPSGSSSLSDGSVYTVNASNSGNSHTLTTSEVAGFSAYASAKEQFEEVLVGQSNVYGLHFMNSLISTNHLTVAPEVTILGRKYYNYEMPEDSIDFKVIERGTISFFAGTYFGGNNAFFSLHQVFRDENQKITAILEIDSVYVNKTAGSNKPYIYKFTNGKYSNADGSYTGANSLDSDYNSTPVFRSQWITNPSGVSQNYRIYYFEIPCNAGEYCLGSVSGKTGAYLLYLDIATNGGDVISTVISTEGNDVTDSFNVEVRDTTNTKMYLNYGGSSAHGMPYDFIFQFEINAPEANESDYSVTVSFTDSGLPNSYRKGLYTISIVNKTNSDLSLSVFICDDNMDVYDEFLYAYEVEYVNKSGSAKKKIANSVNGITVWQSMATFTIPPTGDAAEISYSS